MKANDNILFWDSCFNQFFGKVNFGAVILKPDFFIFYIKMNNAAIDTMIVFPTNVNNLIVIPFSIKNKFSIYMFTGIIIMNIVF